jgi:hypothetical protein
MGRTAKCRYSDCQGLRSTQVRIIAPQLLMKAAVAPDDEDYQRFLLSQAAFLSVTNILPGLVHILMIGTLQNLLVIKNKLSSTVKLAGEYGQLWLLKNGTYA